MSKKCQQCGAEMADNMNFCPQCHKKVETAPATLGTVPSKQPDSSGGTPPQNKGKKITNIIISIIGFLILFGGIAYSQAQPWLLKKARCQSLEKILIRDAGFKKGSVKVRHIKGLRYGIWVISTDDNSPDFNMVLNENTDLWEFPTEADREAMKTSKSMSPFMKD